MRPRAAVFAFTSCEGCSLVILSLEDVMLELLGAVEFVNFREAIDDRREDYDIAFIDGAITSEHEVGELRKIRGRAKTLVAMGACAVQGGLYSLRNNFDQEFAAGCVYGENAQSYLSLPVRPVSHYVDVDHNLYGCPMDRREFLELVRSLITGKKPFVPDYPVCNECRSSGNVCMFELGGTCLGPVTRAGCGAICPAHGTGCCGCRGLVDEPCLRTHEAMMREKGVSKDELSERLAVFNSFREDNGR